MKKNSINQKFQKFTYKPQLAYSLFICGGDVINIEAQFNDSILRHFLGS